jgi:GAF domain-containing protein
VNDESRFPVGSLLEALTQLQTLMLGTPGIDHFLTAAATVVATLAHPSVSCALSLPPLGGADRRSATVGVSAPCAARLHELELAFNEGPSTEALGAGLVVYVEDLAREKRWAGPRQKLLKQGVASVLSAPLQVDGRTVALATLYAPRPRLLGRREVRNVLVVGQVVATALVVRQHADEQLRLNDQLRQAAATRPLIDQALGIVMALRGCTASEAFDSLRVDSQSANQPVREIAAGLVVAATGRPPEPARPFIERAPVELV